MKVALTYVPEKCIYYDDYKFWGAEDDESYGISMFMQYNNQNNDFSANIAYSIGSEIRIAGPYEYVVVTKDETFVFDKEVFVPLEQWNTVLHMYVGNHISVEEVDRIVAGMVVEETDNLTECIPADIAGDGEIYVDDEELEKPPAAIAQENIYQIGDTVIQSSLDISVTDVKVEDSIQEYDRGYFYLDMLPDYINENGSFNFYKRGSVVPGDGVNTVNSYTNVTEVRQKFIYITVKIKNTGRYSFQEFYVNRYKSVFLTEKEDGALYQDEQASYLINMDENIGANFNDPIYFDSSAQTNQSKSFMNMGIIGAGKEYTFHLGYFVDEDLLDELYFAVPYVFDDYNYIKLME